MKLKEPILKRPNDINEYKTIRENAERRLADIVKQEKQLREEYSSTNNAFNSAIDTAKARRREIEKEIKTLQGKLRRAQLDNRKERKTLADERIRLVYDMEHLKGRMRSYLYGIWNKKYEIERYLGHAVEYFEWFNRYVRYKTEEGDSKGLKVLLEEGTWKQ